MAISVHQMLAFSDDINERWFPWLREQDPELLDEDLELSFHSILGVLTHIGNVEHTWMDVVEGDEPDWRNPPYSTKELHEIDPVLEFLAETRERTHALVDDLDEAALEATRQLEDTSWMAKDELTIEELVWIVFTHEQWHRGELIAAFWSRDIQPERLDWHQYATPVGGVGLPAGGQPHAHGPVDDAT